MEALFAYLKTLSRTKLIRVTVGLAIGATIYLSVFTRRAFAFDLPSFFNYQGRLTSPNGVPVPDDHYTIHFSLWSVPDGGTWVWQEDDGIDTKNGSFAVMLGKGTAFPNNVFQQRLWLQTEVNGHLMGPRTELGSVAFAMTALNMPDGTVTTVMIGSRVVTADKLANNAVTTRSIANGAVTEDKLAPGMLVPVGSVISWWGNSDAVPSGWQYCDGSVIADAKSPLKGLATPDLRNRFIRGAGGDVRTSPQIGGQDNVVLTVDQMPPHTHGVSDPGHGHALKAADVYDPGNAFVINDNSGDALVSSDNIVSGGNANVRDGAPYGTKAALTGITIQSAGGGQPFGIVPGYLGLIFIVRIK